MQNRTKKGLISFRSSKVTLRVREKVSTWPGYQDFPEKRQLTRIKCFLRAGLSLLSETLLEEQSSKEARKSIRRLRGKFEGEVILIGNGPSNRHINPEGILSFQQRGGKIAVLNDFAESSWSSSIRPDFYFLSDPNYFNPRTNHYNTLIKIIQYLSEHRNTSFVVPTTRASSTYFQDLPKDQIQFFDGRSCAGIARLSSPDRPWGLPASIALIAIATLKYYGFNRLYFLGLDSDQFKRYSVSDSNELTFNLSTNYFWDNNFTKSRSMLDWPIKNMKNVFYSNAIFFRDFELLCRNFAVNVGRDNTNDTCPRASLLVDNIYPTESGNNES